MASLAEHLETLRAQPKHVRRRIAMGASATVTGLVALGWMGALASSHTLALNTEPAAGEPADMRTALTETRTNFSELLGAAGAAVTAGTSSAAAVMVVDGSVSSTLERDPQNFNNTDKTILTF